MTFSSQRAIFLDSFFFQFITYIFIWTFFSHFWFFFLAGSNSRFPIFFECFFSQVCIDLIHIFLSFFSSFSWLFLYFSPFSVFFASFSLLSCRFFVITRNHLVLSVKVKLSHKFSLFLSLCVSYFSFVHFKAIQIGWPTLLHLIQIRFFFPLKFLKEKKWYRCERIVITLFMWNARNDPILWLSRASIHLIAFWIWSAHYRCLFSFFVFNPGSQLMCAHSHVQLIT